jgi:hypothetical protein
MNATATVYAHSQEEADTRALSYTPGPWNASWSNVVRDHYGVEIAAASHKAHPQEREANARLIAAAPDLLAALRAIASHVPHKHTYPAAAVQDLQQLARAAIAKATKA